jgi:hypothetical protein
MLEGFMDYSNLYFLELIKSAVFDSVPSEPVNEVDWKYIFEKSVEQNVSGLLFCAINKLEKEHQPKEEILAEFKRLMFSTVAIGAEQYNEFLRINKIMREKSIVFIGLKGCIIRNLYPVPELRTMGDFDILTYKRQLVEIRKIFADNGYVVENDAYGIVCSKGIVHWEIFYTIEEEFNINPNKWDKLYFEKIVSKESISFPEKTYFLTHLIIHTAKHLVHTGAGIRNLCDIALFINKYNDSIEYDIVEAACKEQGYYNIFCYIISCMEVIFEVHVKAVNVQRRECQKFLEYMLLNGIYGKNDNTLLMQLTKKQNQDESFAKKLFFPSKNALEKRYKYLSKYPFLLPVAWVHRFFSAIFRWKFSVKQMIKDTRDASVFSSDRKKWLDDLELMDK